MRFADQTNSQSGFTLIELMVVIGIIVLLFALSTINLGQSQNTASVGTITQTLLGNLKSQQILAMSGETGGGSSQQPQGIYFQSNSYTLFAGSSYSSGASNNYVVNLNGQVSLTTTLPSDQIVFDAGDGGVSGFTSGSNTVTITDDGTTQTLTINRFGAIDAN